MGRVVVGKQKTDVQVVSKYAEREDGDGERIAA